MYEYVERLANDFIYMMKHFNKLTLPDWEFERLKKLLMVYLGIVYTKNKINDYLDLMPFIYNISVNLTIFSYSHILEDEELLDLANDLDTSDLMFSFLLEEQVKNLPKPIILKFLQRKDNLLTMIELTEDKQYFEDYKDYYKSLKIPSKYKKQRISSSINELSRELRELEDFENFQEVHVLYETEDLESNFFYRVYNAMSKLDTLAKEF